MILISQCAKNAKRGEKIRSRLRLNSFLSVIHWNKYTFRCFQGGWTTIPALKHFLVLLPTHFMGRSVQTHMLPHDARCKKDHFSNLWPLPLRNPGCGPGLSNRHPHRDLPICGFQTSFVIVHLLPWTFYNRIFSIRFLSGKKTLNIGLSFLSWKVIL